MTLARDALSSSWTQHAASDSHVAHVVYAVEQLVAMRPDAGTLSEETALALDIVTHALEFDQAPDALSVWRAALWQRTLQPRGREAVTRMLEHLMTLAAQGRLDAVAEICNCLPGILRPDVFPAFRSPLPTAP